MTFNIYNVSTGDWADYHTNAPYICCGWMGLHSDKGMEDPDNKRYFKIRPLYVDKNAWLVHWRDGRVAITKPVVGGSNGI